MKLKELTDYLESIAPLGWQESYDNSGLIVGDPAQQISSALISLDCTEQVVDEAIACGANLIISHHPIVFTGLKKFTGANYVERVIIKAIRHGIALYAIHTNLDNVDNGVNRKIANRLDIQDPTILLPKKELLRKLSVFVPLTHADEVRQALFTAGAGDIGSYDQCSFNISGFGTFRANQGADPFVGKVGELHREDEIRIEVIYPAVKEQAVVANMMKIHPYETVAYDIYTLENSYDQVGSGMVGNLPEAMDEQVFLAYLKERLKTKVIRHTKLLNKPIHRVAVCGGAGGFLLKAAIRSGADIFITADYKYHEFFDAEDKIVIADVGHFESEQFTQELLLEIIQEKFPTFAVRLTDIETNPINYYS